VLTPFGTDRRKIFRQSVLLVAVFLLMAMIAVPWDLEISQLVRKGLSI
jgi:hypothetical protein